MGPEDDYKFLTSAEYQLSKYEDRESPADSAA